MQRFWSKVEAGDKNACWLWIGGVSGSGYGVFGVGSRAERKSISSHRLAWELTNGPIPPGLFVCHRCDVRRCCNPSHLFLGTPLENMRDMIAKGRRVAPNVVNRPRGDNHPSRTMPERLKRGTDHHQAKLNDDAVKSIRSSSDAGAVLARRYQVSNVTISRIRRGLLWRHVS